MAEIKQDEIKEVKEITEPIETIETMDEEGLEVQTTFNEDGIDILVEEGDVENVYEEN